MLAVGRMGMSVFITLSRDILNSCTKLRGRDNGRCFKVGFKSCLPIWFEIDRRERLLCSRLPVVTRVKACDGLEERE